MFSTLCPAGLQVRLDHVLHAAAVIGLGRGGPAGQVPAIDQNLDFVGIQHLALDEGLGDPIQRLLVVEQDLLGCVVPSVDQFADFLVNFDRGVFAVVTVLGDFASQEDLLFFLAEGQRSEFAHAPFADHLAGEFGGALDVIASAGGHQFEEDFFRQAAAHQDRDLGFQIVLVVVVTVVGRQLHGQAQAPCRAE